MDNVEKKWTHGLWGAAAGAVALAVVGFTWGGWMTGSGAAKQADAAVSTALLPICADAILANPAAVAQLKTKRSVDYDDVVRDHLKTVGNRTTDYTFWRACGKAIEARMTHAVVK
jgi:alpha/beta superfamily hydrolase